MRIGKNKKNVGQEIHQCDECDEVFNFKTNLKNHKMDHARRRRGTQKRKFEKMCEDENIAKNTAKAADKGKVVSETHKCNECTKKFETKAGINGLKMPNQKERSCPLIPYPRQS